ncbi:hypothetical protein D3C86_1441860 [compost metagenome]
MPLWNKKWGAAGVIPYVFDWNQDGILDLLVTNNYSDPENAAVMFFKGKQKGTPLFEKGIPLFTVKNDAKSFPGDWLNLSVTDWNNDGVNDLLIGTKIAVLNGKFDDDLNWGWEKDNRAGKLNAGYYPTQKIKEIDDKIRNVEKQEKKLKKELGIEEFLKRKKEAKRMADQEKYKTRDDLIKKYYGEKESYKTLVHQGYMYVMLGKK